MNLDMKNLELMMMLVKKEDSDENEKCENESQETKTEYKNEDGNVQKTEKLKKKPIIINVD